MSLTRGPSRQALPLPGPPSLSPPQRAPPPLTQRRRRPREQTQQEDPEEEMEEEEEEEVEDDPFNAPITLATDCSGMDTPVMALRNLGVKIEHVFSCDVSKAAKITIQENFAPKRFYDDLTVRDNSSAERADVYIAGFPCQPFSTAGLRGGFQDMHGRGDIFWHVYDYIAKQRPRVFLLENVAGLVKIEGGKYYKAVMEALIQLGTYNIHTNMVDTKEYGLPQSRRRVYFVGIKSNWDDGTFTWPSRVPLPSMEFFLEPRLATSSVDDLPPERQTTAHANVRQALKEIRANGRNPITDPFIVDCDSTRPRMHYYMGVSPCLTCGRASGHWVTNRMRRMSKIEMMRLQGINPESFKSVVSERQLGTMIGNAMSVNVLERLFVKILPAAGLVEHGTLKDRWLTGLPPPELCQPKRSEKVETDSPILAPVLTPAPPTPGRVKRQRLASPPAAISFA